ncbi:hypothetical protein WJX84_003515 [Apatococcus fuscideae]|uniref:Uncharacterized protein n=1 Tax=Apatococcus fuscideae TaxID=2026836 RepID=A0AAW1SJ54_9CHLO
MPTGCACTTFKGHATAATAIRVADWAGPDEFMAHNLTEAAALIRLRGADYAAANTPTPFNQFWRPSAWADAVQAYIPKRRLMRGEKWHSYEYNPLTPLIFYLCTM